MSFVPTNSLKIYRNFKSIEGTDFHGVVRYYERHEDEICALDFDEYFDCTVAYTHALFEINSFGKHIVMSDNLLETIIMQNIETWGGEDIYTKILFGKALSLFSQDEFAKAEHILRELIKIQPWDIKVINLFKDCMFRQKPRWLSQTRAISVVFILLAAISIAVELFVKPFFPQYFDFAAYVHAGLFFTGIATLIGGESVHWFNCYGKTEDFIGQIRKVKSRFVPK